MHFSNNNHKLYKTIMDDLSIIVRRKLNEYYINRFFKIEDKMNEDDLFFDRHRVLMSPFDPDGFRYSGGGGVGGTASKSFYREMTFANEEREVDFVYNKYIGKFFKTPITHPYKCDGLINTETEDGKKLKIIFEYKYNYDFKKQSDIAAVLVQVIYYLKKFEANGQPLPNICFVGDKNECFVMHTDALNKYLDENVNWSSAPSSAKNINGALVAKIAADKDINPYVYVIDENFSLKEVINQIKDLADNVQRHIHITEHNIQSIYEYFCDRVLINKDKFNTKDTVALFIGVLTDKNNFYMHPRKKNVMVAQKMGKEFPIKQDALDAFFNYFSDEYSVSEKRVFAGIADRLIEDTDRRKSGDFWTPTKWVDYAHQRLSEVLGDNWKDEFVVWDNCAGTCNLTRDYKFKELYISTLFDSELQMGEKFNKEAVHFQFDFLNDDIPMPNSLFESGMGKLPDGLVEAFRKNKKILFFINPPYARNGGSGISSGTNGSVAFTKVNSMMKNEGYGPCSANLYAQFLYRIEKLKREYKLTDCYIAVFCPTLFLSGSSYENFRENFLNDFEYLNGFQFQASQFANVADSWGIGFTIWKSGETKDKENFELDICDVDKESYTGDIENQGEKCIYNADNSERASIWVKTAIKGNEQLPTFSSGLKMNNKKGIKVSKNCMGSMMLASSNVDFNAQGVAIYSSLAKVGGRYIVPIEKDNFIRCTCLFAARRLIAANWMNWTDEYLAPDTTHPDFEEFANDSVVYSLFESKSNQSSLRNVSYANKNWEIKNEFFWMTKKEIMALANKTNEECYNDAIASSPDDRFVCKYLQAINLSPEAQAVLDKATELVEDSFQYRELFNEDHPEYQINNWDCGYYQLKALWKIYMPNEFEEFKALFKTLADKMRPQVYELGFLKK